MTHSEVHYVRLDPAEDTLPSISQWRPFNAVVVIQAEYSDAWQERVSDWLVASGCLYMMSWGDDCYSWDESVDWANLRQFNHGEIPDEHFVMTSWHDDQPLRDVLGFAGGCSAHLDDPTRHLLIIHLSRQDEEEGMMMLYEKASDPDWAPD